ncbi:regulator of G-protein signaling 5-like [Paramormyrops kingsleyae]|uniref:regulator of G-protein signaling 5-like n=1 Tax=Paramormyrops kingsleyae TaxID=1676925 RepID=UPI003B97012D
MRAFPPDVNMRRGIASLPDTFRKRAKVLKANLSSFLKKTQWILSSHPYETDQLNSTTQVESLKWKGSFDRLLENKDGLLTFRAFLVSEYSEENIDFYLACEDYKSTKSPDKLKTKAKDIYEEFIQRDASREVNIDQKTRDFTKNNLEECKRMCFDIAQLEVYTLMEKDCYPRFLRSATFKDREKYPKLLA